MAYSIFEMNNKINDYRMENVDRLIPHNRVNYGCSKINSWKSIYALSNFYYIFTSKIKLKLLIESNVVQLQRSHFLMRMATRYYICYVQ